MYEAAIAFSALLGIPVLSWVVVLLIVAEVVWGLVLIIRYEREIKGKVRPQKPKKEKTPAKQTAAEERISEVADEVLAEEILANTPDNGDMIAEALENLHESESLPTTEDVIARALAEKEIEEEFVYSADESTEEADESVDVVDEEYEDKPIEQPAENTPLETLDEVVAEVEPENVPVTEEIEQIETMEDVVETDNVEQAETPVVDDELAEVEAEQTEVTEAERNSDVESEQAEATGEPIEDVATTEQEQVVEDVQTEEAEQTSSESENQAVAAEMVADEQPAGHVYGENVVVSHSDEPIDEAFGVTPLDAQEEVVGIAAGDNLQQTDDEAADDADVIVEEAEAHVVDEPTDDNEVESQDEVYQAIEQVAEQAEEQNVEETASEEVVDSEPSAEEVVIDEDVADETDDGEQSADADEEALQGELVFDDKTIVVRYSKSFTAKLIQSKDETKTYYAEIANNLLSYKKVKNRISWAYSSFNRGRVKLAKLAVRGKTLSLYLALDPSKVDKKYHVTDVSHVRKYEAVPCRLRIKSARAVKYAKELIAMACNDLQIEANPKFVPVVFANDFPYDTTENLIVSKLIKVNAVNGEDIPEERIVAGGFTLRESVTVDEAHTLISDADANALLVNEKVAPTRGKKFVVNIDVLSGSFNNGDIVDIEALKRKKLIPKKETAIKVLARGVLNKSLIVKANDFSADAIKMIVLTGGKAIKV